MHTTGRTVAAAVTNGAGDVDRTGPTASSGIAGRRVETAIHVVAGTVR